MMKKILYGIALILFGFFCIYIAALGTFAGIDTVGIVVALAGIYFATRGFIEKEE